MSVVSRSLPLSTAETEPLPLATSERRYDLDWLRVLAVLVLLVYHVNLIFDPHEIWVIKSPLEISAITLLDDFLHQWRLPLLFLVSGASSYLALGHRSAGAYLADRLQRIVIPLIFGVLILVPPQEYLRSLSLASHNQARFEPSPLTFLRQYARAVLQEKPPSGHLWYLEYLLIFSVVALPLFVWLRAEAGRRVAERAAAVLARGLRIHLLALPLVMIDLVLMFALPHMPGVPASLAGYVQLHAVRYEYFLFFVYGFLVAGNERLGAGLQRYRRLNLGLALILFVIERLISGYPYGPLAALVFKANAWIWVAVALGYARHYLSGSNRFLRYAAPLVAPFYILHQTVIVGLGYLILQFPLALSLTYSLILVGSCLITGLLCDLIRRYNISRVLFGMRALPKDRSRTKSLIEEPLWKHR